MKNYILFFFFYISILNPIYSTEKITDWNNTGSSSNLPSNASIIDLKDFGLKSDNSTDNSLVIKNAIKALNGKAGILKIPTGSYLINKTISIPSNIVISGAGSDKTILNFNLNGNGDLFSIQGAATAISTPVLSGSKKESISVKVSNAANFASG
jgi:hypothetical protein